MHAIARRELQQNAHDTGRLPRGRGGRRMNSLDKVLATHGQGVEHGFVF